MQKIAFLLVFLPLLLVLGLLYFFGPPNVRCYLGERRLCSKPKVEEKSQKVEAKKTYDKREPKKSLKLEQEQVDPVYNESSDKLACENGDAGSCHTLALSEKGKGRITEARKFFKLACEKGEAIDCYHLGNLEEEDGNTEAAIESFRLACDGNESLGCSSFREAVEKAQKGGGFYKASCRKGDSDCYLRNREGETSDTNQASENLVKAYKFACDEGAIGSCFRLAQMEEKEGNLEDAKMFYKFVCDRYDSRGCYRLARMEKNEENLIEAEKYYELACDGGEALACSELKKLESKTNPLGD